MTAARRLPALDGVRALAIGLVVAYHLQGFLEDVQGHDLHLPAVLSTIIDGGWIGVPLFFVLSGFLVGGALVRQVESGSLRFGRFYSDRSFRILPVAFAYLVFYGVLVVPGAFGFNSWTLANFCYVSNRIGIETPLHFWSLQIEELFYSVAPLLVFLLAKHSRSTLSARSMALAIVAWWVLRFPLSTALAPQGADPYRDGVNYLDFFIAGALAARLSGNAVAVRTFAARCIGNRSPLAAALVVTLPVLYVYATLPLHESWALALCYPTLCAWAFAVVLFAAVEADGSTLSKLFGSRPAHLVAVLSYSIYVWHIDLLKVASFPGLSIGQQVALDLVAIVVGTVTSFYLIERPFLWMRDLIRAKQNGAVHTSKLEGVAQCSVA